MEKVLAILDDRQPVNVFLQGNIAIAVDVHRSHRFCFRSNGVPGRVATRSATASIGTRRRRHALVDEEVLMKSSELVLVDKTVPILVKVSEMVHCTFHPNVVP